MCSLVEQNGSRPQGKESVHVRWKFSKPVLSAPDTPLPAVSLTSQKRDTVPHACFAQLQSRHSGFPGWQKVQLWGALTELQSSRVLEGKLLCMKATSQLMLYAFHVEHFKQSHKISKAGKLPSA